MPREDIERYGLNDRSYCVCSCEVALLDKKWDLQAIVQMLKNFLDIIENKHDYHIVRCPLLWYVADYQ